MEDTPELTSPSSPGSRNSFIKLLVKYLEYVEKWYPAEAVIAFGWTFLPSIFKGQHLESEEKKHRIGFLKLIKLEVSLQPFIKYVGCMCMICCITLGLTKRENLFKAQALDIGLQHLCGEKREDQRIIRFLVDDCHLCIYACICIHKRVSTSFTCGFQRETTRKIPQRSRHLRFRWVWRIWWTRHPVDKLFTNLSVHCTGIHVYHVHLYIFCYTCVYTWHENMHVYIHPVDVWFQPSTEGLGLFTSEHPSFGKTFAQDFLRYDISKIIQYVDQ